MMVLDYAASVANPSQYFAQVGWSGMSSMNFGSPSEPPNSRRHDTDTLALKNSTSTSMVSVASPHTTEWPVSLRNASWRLKVSDAEMSPSTDSSPCSRT